MFSITLRVMAYIHFLTVPRFKVQSLVLYKATIFDQDREVKEVLFEMTNMTNWMCPWFQKYTCVITTLDFIT